VIAAPPIRIDHAVQGDLPTNNRLQRGFSTIRDEFGVALSITLENSKNDRLAVGASALFSFDATGSKIGLIDFDLAAEGRLRFAECRDAFSNSPDLPVDGVAVQASQESNW
jgi:hypothetical protein